MITLVRIELLKMRTTPASWLTGAVIAALTVVSGVVTILLAGKSGAAPLGSARKSATPWPSGPRPASACSSWAS